ncbi:MAG: YihY/virulence factor BrkB family protein [Candidatus Eisenbacteria bacterium]
MARRYGSLARTLGEVGKNAASGFFTDQVPSLAASISFYAMFSLPPLIVLLLAGLGLAVDPVEVQHRLLTEVRRIVGSGATQQIRDLIELAESSRDGSRLTTIFGVGALLFGATGALVQLQTALDQVWRIRPRRGPIKLHLIKRALSLTMILAIGFLLAVSMFLSAGVSWLSSVVASKLPDWFALQLLVTGQVLVSLLLTTVLFAAMFRFLTRARMRRRDLWVGAATTALLFQGGQWIFAIYLAKADPGSLYGAAGSLALVLLWVYYSANVFLFGAEFTRAWADGFGDGVRAKGSAERVRVGAKSVA